MTRDANDRNEDHNDDQKPSKSAVKRELADLQRLAEQMTTLRDSELARLGVDPALREALGMVRSMKPSGARQRQIRYCVRLMDIDALQQVRDQLTAGRARHAAVNRRFHTAEQWRDRLRQEGDEALAELVSACPAIDRQHVRRLVRDAVREQESGKPPGAGRKLFRYLVAQLDTTATDDETKKN
jgi:ribosome-associated protein